MRNAIPRAAIAAAGLLALPLLISAAPAKDEGRASAAFERFRALSGRWQAKSTKGWEEDMKARVIAAGSVVVMNSFDAHPDEEMLTTLVLDEDRLLLTHYCVARNQPRLEATEISKDGRRVTFTFVDGTNLPSRDRGHMDKAVYHFEDDDRFTSRWTWYQDGKEKWMEEIRYRRHGAEASADAGSR